MIFISKMKFLFEKMKFFRNENFAVFFVFVYKNEEKAKENNTSSLFHISRHVKISFLFSRFTKNEKKAKEEKVVEVSGFEPLTFALQRQRSTN